MSRGYLSSFTLWLTFIFSADVLATPTPQQFFPQNYANEVLMPQVAIRNPSDTNTDKQLDPNNSSNQLSAGTPSAKDAPLFLSSIPNSILSGDPKIDAAIIQKLRESASRAERSFLTTANPQQQPAATVPTSIMVYVNSLDREHFNRLTQSVIRFNGSNDFKVSGVLQMGDWRNVTKEQEDALKASGTFVHQIAFLPEHLKGLSSPIWEVRSGDSIAYLSGVFNVSRFFSPSGAVKLEQDSDKKLGSDIKLDGF